MKALIIEDDNFKLETAIRVLKNYGIQYTHLNNYSEAMRLVSDDQLKNFDFIILDLNFYQYRPSRITLMTPKEGIGYNFLYHMIGYGTKNNVIIFSSDADYQDGWNNFLFPTFKDFFDQFNDAPHFRFPSLDDLEERYEDLKKQNAEIANQLDFVIGHAHNEFELSDLVKNFIEAN